MKLCKHLLRAMAFTAIISTSAQAETVVNVTLIDKVGTTDLSKSPSLGLGMDGDMKMAKMGININPKAVPRGAVKFNVTNLASSLIHEVIIARLSDETQKLPYDESHARVVEDALQTFGSVNEIDPSKSASITLDLSPGKYLLYCNLPGHFMAGMWTIFEVQ